MASILRRLLVEDVEETKRHLEATAADRRRRGVAGEAYFTSPERPNQLIVVFDGENVAQLHTAIHPVNPDRGSEVPAPTQPTPAEPSGLQVEVIAQLQIARDAMAVIEQQLAEGRVRERNGDTAPA